MSTKRRITTDMTLKGKYVSAIHALFTLSKLLACLVSSARYSALGSQAENDVSPFRTLM